MAIYEFAANGAHGFLIPPYQTLRVLAPACRPQLPMDKKSGRAVDEDPRPWINVFHPFGEVGSESVVTL